MKNNSVNHAAVGEGSGIESQSTRPLSSYLHLKAPTEGRDHNAPTLCGLEDPGVYAYESATRSNIEALHDEPCPLCPKCLEVFARGEVNQSAKPQHSDDQ